MMDKTEKAIRDFIEVEIDFIKNEGNAHLVYYIAKNVLFQTQGKVSVLIDLQDDIREILKDYLEIKTKTPPQKNLEMFNDRILSDQTK
jgi:hypothetical protein